VSTAFYERNQLGDRHDKAGGNLVSMLIKLTVPAAPFDVAAGKSVNCPPGVPPNPSCVRLAPRGAPPFDGEAEARKKRMSALGPVFFHAGTSAGMQR